MLAADVIAGITVGLVALPLAMAFAIASGMKPESGIYTAVVAGFVVSALGGSRCQIAGPTGAFVVIVAGIVAKYGVAGLLACTMMAGGILVLMGICGLGTAVRYIPRPVTIGFTNGIAVLIASTQIKDFLGLRIEHSPGEFIGRLKAVGQNIQTFNTASIVVASLALAIILLIPRWNRRIPGSIVALLLTTVLVALTGLNVATIGSAFGGVPTGLPKLQWPELPTASFFELLPSALTVAMLAAIESLLSAVVADNMSGDRHKPDVELVAQGLANLVVPFVGGLPATGAIARTATNIRCGAKSPVAGIVHALCLLAILLVAAPLARFIPLPTLAAVLLVVAYNMGEWHEIPSLVSQSRADRVVWMATFALTVFADLTVAVEVGMVLAALLYIQKVSATTSVAAVSDDELKEANLHVLVEDQIPPFVSVIRIQGPFLFGASEKLEEAAEGIEQLHPVVILKLRHMTALDTTGMHAIEKFAMQVEDSGRSMIFCGVRDQPRRVMRKSRLYRRLGRDRFVPHVKAAFERARQIHAGDGRTDTGFTSGLTLHDSTRAKRRPA